MLTIVDSDPSQFTLQIQSMNSSQNEIRLKKIGGNLWTMLLVVEFRKLGIMDRRKVVKTVQ